MRQAEWASLLREYHAAKVAEAKAKSLSEKIKSAMEAEGVDTVEAGGFIASITVFNSSRLDGKRLKADHADLYAAYTVATTTKRLNLK